MVFRVYCKTISLFVLLRGKRQEKDSYGSGKSHALLVKAARITVWFSERLQTFRKQNCRPIVVKVILQHY